MERTSGAHVAFLTQDALPASETWLEALLSGFALAERRRARLRALACRTGRAAPDRPRARRMVRRASRASTAPASPPDRAWRRSSRPPTRRSHGPPGPRCRSPTSRTRRTRRSPARCSRAGYAKVYTPDAAVIHSHDYAALAQFRRTFDEWRALHEVHGWVQPLEPLNTLLKLQSEVRKDLRGLPPRELVREAPRSVRHWTVRAARLDRRLARRPAAGARARMVLAREACLELFGDVRRAAAEDAVAERDHADEDRDGAEDPRGRRPPSALGWLGAISACRACWTIAANGLSIISLAQRSRCGPRRCRSGRRSAWRRRGSAGTTSQIGLMSR